MMTRTVGPRLEGLAAHALVLGSVIDWINASKEHVMVTYVPKEGGDLVSVESLCADSFGIRILTLSGVRLIAWTEMTLKKLGTCYETKYCDPELVRKQLGFED